VDIILPIFLEVAVQTLLKVLDMSELRADKCNVCGLVELGVSAHEIPTIVLKFPKSLLLSC
jgi:hypothetical protein